MSLRQRDGSLFFEPEGQGEHALSYDDAGDFFPTVVDDAVASLELHQGGQVLSGKRGE